jgi:hypothetical protein
VVVPPGTGRPRRNPPPHYAPASAQNDGVRASAVLQREHLRHVGECACVFVRSYRLVRSTSPARLVGDNLCLRTYSRSRSNRLLCLALPPYNNGWEALLLGGSPPPP